MDTKIEDAICRFLKKAQKYAPEECDCIQRQDFSLPAQVTVTLKGDWDKPFKGGSRHRYSKADDETLRSMWSTHTTDEIGRRLDRSVQSIRARAGRLGLREASHAA
jgi:hypothetical protein